LFGAMVPFVARRVSPALATWLLSTGGLVSALSGAGALAVLGMTFIAQNPAIAAEGHWSISALRRADPVRFPVAIAALTLLAIALGRAGWVMGHRGRAFAAAYRMNRAVEDNGADVVILAQATTDAYAVPGRPGRVFVSEGMLATLDRDEYDAMLAHERSHLRHHHHWHRAAAQLAHALNPLLLRLPRTQVWLTERWADEDAAHDHDRMVVASALTRAAAAGVTARPHGVLTLAGDPVEQRVAALLDERPRRRPVTVLVTLTILVLSVCGTLDGATDEATLLHSAISAPVTSHLGPLGHHMEPAPR
jgi:Zn-dependent protease with chaperone function